MKKREQLLFNSNSALLNGVSELAPNIGDTSNQIDEHTKADSIIVKA